MGDAEDNLPLEAQDEDETICGVLVVLDVDQRELVAVPPLENLLLLKLYALACTSVRSEAEPEG